MADDPTPTPQTNSQYPTTEAELHYKSLTDLFKFLVTLTAVFIGILTAAGVYVGYKDMAAMRAEVRQNLLDVKSETRQNMSDVKADTKTVVDSTKDEARTSIQNAKNTTDAQISQIRDRSGAIALTEAQRRVDEAFRNRNIEAMVENAASRQVAPVIERQLRSEVDRAIANPQGDITFLGQISDAVSYARTGGRQGLDRLLSLQKAATDETMRIRVRSILDTMAEDWERASKDWLREAPGSTPLDEIESYNSDTFKGVDESHRKKELTKFLIRVIQTGRSLRDVGYATLALRDLTGHPFRMFDMDELNTWCKENQNQCQ
ncbi:MAG: hypothetical protein QOH70_1988 [Blastocatellia bacterium]|jgi:Tfp pilus assembly major pilin PilA|nr:hypothetical protein [Blastocatellia bacterium]